MDRALIICDEDELLIFRNSVDWFLSTQDPELDDAVYDRNDEVILKEILSPRIVSPFDPCGGTSKDLGLLIQCLETALAKGGLQGPEPELLLEKLRAYEAKKKQRLTDSF